MNIRDLIPEGQRDGTSAMVKQIARGGIADPYHTNGSPRTAGSWTCGCLPLP